MKKLITVSSFFVLFILLLAGCQNSSNITSPDNSLDKPTPPPVYNYNCTLTASNSGGTATVDLVAGQHNPVGTATFTLNTDGTLDISYTLDAGVGTISEIHIDFATALNNDAANGGFHANSQGSPQPGQFDINTTTTGTSWSTTVSKADLLNYLNSSGPNVPDPFYIAAHGVVNYPTTGGAGTCPTLPNGKWRYLDWHPGNNYYVQGAELYESNDLSSTLILDNLNGWCVDRSRPVEGFNQDVWNQVDFLCSTEDLTGLCLVDKPENINAVNWLLNNKTYAGTPSMVDIQVTIWELISNNNDYSNYTYDANRVATLKAAALEHSDFVPGCGQIIGSLMYSSNTNYCNGGGIQVILIERTVECGGGGSDTMWGFKWDFDNNEPLEDYSCRFVDQGNWARYFRF